jgi:hypothetical protein
MYKALMPVSLAACGEYPNMECCGDAGRLPVFRALFPVSYMGSDEVPNLERPVPAAIRGLTGAPKRGLGGSVNRLLDAAVAFKAS